MWKHSQGPALSWTHPRTSTPPLTAMGFILQPSTALPSKKGKKKPYFFFFFPATELLNTITKAELTIKTIEIVETFTYLHSIKRGLC